MTSRHASLTVAALLAATAAHAGEPSLLAEYKAPPNTFIDDAFALSDDGKLLAWVSTDGATGSQLHVVAPGGPDPEATCKVPTISAERIDFLDGGRLLLVERSPETHLVRAQVFTTKCVGKEKLGPASEIALGKVGDVPAIVSWLRSPKGNVFTHSLTAVRRDDLRPLAKKVLAEDADGRVTVAGKRMKPLFWLAGFTELVAQKEGDFDPKHDIRKPDAAAHVDPFGGKVLQEREIGDVIAWTTLSNLRKKHQNESDFVQFSEDLKRFELVDRDDQTADLKTPRPLRKYDPTTLASQPLGDGVLAVSLTIDPVNPDAVAAKKADQDWLELFRLEAKERKLVELARIDGKKRPSGWRLGGTRIAVLRKHKSMGRGGSELEVLDLSPAPPPKPAAPTAPAPKPAAPPVAGDHAAKGSTPAK